MSTDHFTYMTFHHVRFPNPVNANECSLNGPLTALHWLSGPTSPIGQDGLRTRISATWCGLGFYRSRNHAEAVLDDLDAQLPFSAETIEAWHAVLCPISHRGQTNWFGELDAANQFQPLDDDPGGPMVVMTSAGFNPLPPEELKLDLPRRKDFIANVDRVLKWFATLPGNVVREAYQLGKLSTDGLTFSLWAGDEEMLAAAYRPGIHRTQLDRYKVEHTADRSSFTRARVLRCSGTWDGASLA